MSGRGGRQKQMPGSIPAPQRQVTMQQRQGAPAPQQRPGPPPQQRPGAPQQQRHATPMQQRQAPPPPPPPPVQQQPIKQSKPKMTIGDAIGLITIRLGRVEQFIQQLQTDGIDINSLNTSQPPDLFDDGLIQNIVSRLNTIEQSETDERIKTMENDLKDTKNLLIKLMLKFETFSDDTLAKFEDQQHQITFNLEQLQQEEALYEVEDGADETNEANGAQEVLNQEEQAAAPSNESEPVP